MVAKLPFEPWPFFQKITHRGLAGSNATDAALVQLPSTPCERHYLQTRSCSVHVSVLRLHCNMFSWTINMEMQAVQS